MYQVPPTLMRWTITVLLFALTRTVALFPVSVPSVMLAGRLVVAAAGPALASALPQEEPRNRPSWGGSSRVRALRPPSLGGRLNHPA